MGVLAKSRRPRSEGAVRLPFSILHSRRSDRQQGLMGKKKNYNKRKDRKTGKRVPAHRLVASKMLGRPLLPAEVVHHRDGNIRNNVPENLLVLPSQAAHANLEHVLRRARTGQHHLLPELLVFTEGPKGSLFEAVAIKTSKKKSG